MIRFVKHKFEGMEGIEIYPIIALLTFFTIFVLMILFVIKMKKKHIDEVSNYPLEDDNQLNNENYE